MYSKAVKHGDGSIMPELVELVQKKEGYLRAPHQNIDLTARQLTKIDCSNRRNTN